VRHVLLWILLLLNPYRLSIAAVDTTAMIISILLYFIAIPISIASKSGEGSPPQTNPFQERLFSELCGLDGNTSSNVPIDGRDHPVSCGARFKNIDSLPFLDALVKETLRLRAAGPCTQLRVVPPGRTLSIQGLLIPSGTEVGVHPWTMHRKDNVWERAEEFIPERWLPSNLGGWGPEPGSDSYDEMTKHFMPFGNGVRICAGRNMALMETKLVVGSLVRHFEIKVDRRETNDRTMEPRDSHFVSHHLSRKCFQAKSMHPDHISEIRGV